MSHWTLIQPSSPSSPITRPRPGGGPSCRHQNKDQLQGCASVPSCREGLGEQPCHCAQTPCTHTTPPNTSQHTPCTKHQTPASRSRGVWGRLSSQIAPLLGPCRDQAAQPSGHPAPQPPQSLTGLRSLQIWNEHLFSSPCTCLSFLSESCFWRALPGHSRTHGFLT